MKKTIALFAILFALTATAQQQQKQDSLILEIKMDTATYKYVTQLIKENIDGRTMTGATILNNILAPLSNYKLVQRETIVADKLKELPSKAKN